ncbi:MAG: ABC transporter substrate-binding protein [Ignavibacteriales bacterium]|nr:MAG: ABC transporter substrate-binding protein [Ignavibacteriales bacterium]
MKSTIIILVIVSIIGNGCKSNSREVVNVKCALKWIHHSQFAGLYVAEEKGLFRNNNINLTFLPGGLGKNEIIAVTSGDAQIGITSAEQILIARSRGINVKCLAVIFRFSPVCFFSKKNKQILTPFDFIGKRVAVQHGTNVEIEYSILLKELGIDELLINEIPTSHNLQLFFEDKIDVWNGYIFNEPLIAEEHGMTLNIIQAKDYGINFYADCIFATDSFIEKNPEKINNLVNAMLKGWMLVYENQKESVNSVLRKNKNLDFANEFRKIEMIKNLIRLENTAAIGNIDKNILQYMYNKLSENGFLGDVKFDISDCFTNRYNNSMN